MSAAGSPAAGATPLTKTKRPLPDGADDESGHEPVANGRQCFITIGATAGFRQLLEEALDSEFLKCLSSYGYDRLDIQCGPDHEWFKSQVLSPSPPHTYGLKIRHFSYTNDMQSHMVECRGKVGHRPPGCIISHAGSGTILEALRYQAPLIVVPNPTLMDNHQAELAEECERQNWAIYGTLGNLADAVRRSHERLAQGRQSSTTTDTVNPQSPDEDGPECIPPPYSPPPFPVPESERVTFFDWMVLTCYPEELATQQHLLELPKVEEEVARAIQKEDEMGQQSMEEQQMVRDRRRARLLLQIE